MAGVTNSGTRAILFTTARQVARQEASRRQKQYPLKKKISQSIFCLVAVSFISCPGFSDSNTP